MPSLRRQQQQLSGGPKSREVELFRFAKAFPVDMWEDLDDEEVVVLNEQGLGDTIQFTRFAQGIVAQGGRPVFEVPHSLAPLIVQADNFHRVIREG